MERAAQAITDNDFRSFQQRFAEFYSHLPEGEQLLLGDLVQRAVRRNELQSEISELYEDWFIETCEDWAVPYIGDLLGDIPIRPQSHSSRLWHISEAIRSLTHLTDNA